MTAKFFKKRRNLPEDLMIGSIVSDSGMFELFLEVGSESAFCFCCFTFLGRRDSSGSLNSEEDREDVSGSFGSIGDGSSGGERQIFRKMRIPTLILD